MAHCGNHGVIRPRWNMLIDVNILKKLNSEKAIAALRSSRPRSIEYNPGMIITSHAMYKK